MNRGKIKMLTFLAANRNDTHDKLGSQPSTPWSVVVVSLRTFTTLSSTCPLSWIQTKSPCILESRSDLSNGYWITLHCMVLSSLQRNTRVGTSNYMIWMLG